MIELTGIAKVLTNGGPLDKTFAMTTSVHARIGVSEEFAKFVLDSVKAFKKGDWGDIDPNDKELNDADRINIDNGSFGRIIASYDAVIGATITPRIWIVEDNTSITVLYPEEY
jgi:hypothetical protein